MTQTKHTCRGGRPSGARRSEASRTATRRGTRVRVSSDAVISAYIRDIARPHGGGKQHAPHRIMIPASGSEPHARAPLQRLATADA